MVTRNNNDNKLSTTVYRKPTHTDRLLDQSSYNPTSHKATTIQTLTRRAQLVCGSPDRLADENNYLDNVFNKNNYNKDFVRRNTYKNTEPNVTNNDATPVSTVTIPYVRGTSETIARILQPYNIRVAHKPITTLRQLLTKVKDKDEPNRRQGAVYKIEQLIISHPANNLLNNRALSVRRPWIALSNERGIKLSALLFLFRFHPLEKDLSAG